MMSNSRVKGIIAGLTVLILMMILQFGQSDARKNQVNALDAVIAFEQQAGWVGRSDLYAIEQLRKTEFLLANDVATLPRVSISTAITDTLTNTAYLPLTAATTLAPMVERRGLWVTRYDWTSYFQTPTPGDIATIVNNAAFAGFNTLFFQIRASGDSYYTPGLEPWAARLTTGPVSETLGVDPGWDPLAVMLQLAHEAGIEVHAYFNVYTAWLSPPDASQGELWPPRTVPTQMFDLFTYGKDYQEHPGLYGLGYKWRQYQYPDTPMALTWNHYLWASPGVDEVQDYIASVAADIVSRYAVDGLHLDLVRYAGPSYSYDPASNTASGSTRTFERDQWQRDRISTLVATISTQAHTLRPDILISAAVWPVYVDKWGWGTSQGYSDYFQDSKGWLQTGAVDAITPMLYGGVADDYSRWQVLMDDFLTTQSEGQIYPGIGVYDDFAVLNQRITATRTAAADGHVIFSYSGLKQRGFWDDLRQGPYAIPAIVPIH